MRAVAILPLAVTPLLAFGAPPLATGTDFSACGAVVALDLSEAATGVRITTAVTQPAAGDQPALCRIAGTIPPAIGFEVRLPEDDWNGRLLVTGCSNLCGAIQVQGMEDALARGYATATTDMGHQSDDVSDATWADNNPGAEADFGHRATHLSTRVAKALVAGYYGTPASFAYFRGCSTGGRQGLVAAARYPADFDGIIAGAPFDQSLSVPHMAWALAANTDEAGAPILTGPQFDLLRRAALAACDGLDGLEDGVIGDPSSCSFRPASLACDHEGAEQTTDEDRGWRRSYSGDGMCLTAAQVAAAEAIYGGPRTSAGEPLTLGGAPIGTEGSWERMLVDRPGQPAYFRFIVQNWSRYLAYEPDPPAGAGPFGFDFDRWPAQLAATMAVQGYRSDLNRFRALGGRLILYHGWQDESLMPAHTLDYWRRLAARSGGVDGLDGFARLFLVPGMSHCGGGPGATEIDFLSAIEAWVERDEAPEALIAYRTANSVSTALRQPRFPLPADAVLGSRPVYPWPHVAIYDGEGDPRDAASFRRTRPDATHRPAEN